MSISVRADFVKKKMKELYFLKAEPKRNQSGTKADPEGES